MILFFRMERKNLQLIKDTISSSINYLKVFLKWVALSVMVGLVGGILGTLFHKSIDYVTEIRVENSWLIFLLPFGGLVIAFIYRLFKSKGNIDTNRVLEAAGKDKNVPIIMIPLIFVSTIITHLLGGSAGREGAALQLGGGIGYNLGRIVKLSKNDMHVIVMAGMSSVFAALFGTPLTAAFFALEVTSVGILHYVALVPCVISSLVSYRVALYFGVTPVRFSNITAHAISIEVVSKVVILAVLCALVSILFCIVMRKSEHCMKNFFPNIYLRAAVGAAMLIALTLIVGTYDYNGAGMDVITRAIEGNTRPEAFILKIIFTAITISAGFKGGEIVPAFFIGSTFGCTVGGLLGLNPGVGAAIGFVALFCGVVNCPIASLMLAIEVFGAENALVFALACSISYMMSGYFGLYKSQKIVYSKLNEDEIDIYTR